MVLLRAGIVIALIAVVDWRFDVNISFGFLYLFPMIMVGTCLTRWQIGAVAALCTALCEAFDAFPWDVTVGLPRLILTFAAFFGAGLYVFETVRNRRLASLHLEEIEKESELRREAEEQLEFLIDSSPASIFSMDQDCRVLLANDAAHRLLGVAPGSLKGQALTRFLPALRNVPHVASAPYFRTTMECRCQRQDGEVFLAQIWFSTYSTLSGPRLAAVVLDVSEELRDREEFSLQQLLAGSRLLVGAVCHEIRNICGAIGVVHEHLGKDVRLAESEDFRALGRLVDGLGRMAGIELRQTAKREPEVVDLSAVLEELRIIIEPSLRESGIASSWHVPPTLPPVWAEHETLLQALLNIAKNSQRALEDQPEPRLEVRAQEDRASVVIRFIDSGPGVTNPDRLFKPFQTGTAGTGLGLYLSRAFVRAFQGEIEHRPQTDGCCFAVILTAASDHAGKSKGERFEDSSAAARRSHAVSGEPQPAARD